MGGARRCGCVVCSVLLVLVLLLLLLVLLLYLCCVSVRVCLVVASLWDQSSNSTHSEICVAASYRASERARLRVSECLSAREHLFENSERTSLGELIISHQTASKPIPEHKPSVPRPLLAPASLQ